MKKAPYAFPLVLAVFSDMALAQSTPQPFYPKCWMWSYPKNSLTADCEAWKRSDYLIPMIRIDHRDYDQGSTNPTTVAAAVRTKITNLKTLGYLDPVNPQIAVLIQNYGKPHELDMGNSGADADPTSP